MKSAAVGIWGITALLCVQLSDALADKLVQTVPGRTWEVTDPAATGWSLEGLEAAKHYANTRRPTALMIVQDGKLIADWGDVRRKVNVASVRKSLVGALYGIAISEGRINLDSTLAMLGVDDTAPSLTSAEKQATVRDLLMARSGIYHPAAYETADIRQKRPKRGSHAPGSFWFYNNWDFNALGTIYRQATGEDIFQSFERRIALPIGMEDFTAHDGQYRYEASSAHPAYPFSMSARDLARFGLLFLNGGQWQGKQVIPGAWVRQSTSSYSQTDRRNRGYGFLWWTLPADEWGDGAALASGYGGQLIAHVPSKRLVVVQTMDLRRSGNRLRTPEFLDLLERIMAAAP